MKRYHYYQLISGILFFLMLFFVLFVSERILWLGMLGLVATGFTSVFLANKAGDMKRKEIDQALKDGTLKIEENTRAFLTDPNNGRCISVRATADHPSSSYGKLVWVDKKGIAYCQCDSPGNYDVEVLIN